MERPGQAFRNIHVYACNRLRKINPVAMEIIVKEGKYIPGKTDLEKQFVL